MYRVKAGTEVLVEFSDGSRSLKIFNRDVEFPANKLIYSPLTEHHKSGKATISPWHNYPWGFDTHLKWKDGERVYAIYAAEAHYVSDDTSRDVKTVVVAGSEANQYTLTLDENDKAFKCSCPAFRYQKTSDKECKHIKKWNLVN